MLKKCLATLLVVTSGLATTVEAGSHIESMKRRFPDRPIYMPYALATSDLPSSLSFLEDYPRRTTQSEQNLAWYRQRLGQHISVDSLRMLVYEFSSEDLSHALKATNLPSYLQALKKDKELYTYLSIAKEVEGLRPIANVWGYTPNSEQEQKVARERLLKKVMSYKQGALLDRYTLLACRLLTTQGQYPEVLRLWSERSSAFSDNLIKAMTEGYVASAWYNTNKKSEAKEFYKRIGDLESLLYIYRIEHKKPVLSPIEQIRVGLQWISEHPNYVRILTRLLNYTEAYDLSIYQLGQEALKKNPSSALWNYTLAFLYNRHKDDSRFEVAGADQYFARAVSSSKALNPLLGAEISHDLEKAITLLSFHRGGVEQEQVFTWFRGEMSRVVGEFKNSEEMIYSLQHMGRPAVLEAELSTYLQVSGFRNYTYNRVESLRKQNIASSMMTDLYVKGLRYDRSKWNPYYSTDFFVEFFSHSSDSEAEEYVQTYVGNKLGYNDADYLYDALGTKFLASGDYSKAVEYLTKVSPHYMEQMNIRHYLKYDPFSKMKRLSNQSTLGYKLSFAKEMQRLKNHMYLERNENDRAEAMLRFAQGLESAHTSCWMLTRYSDGMPYIGHETPGESKGVDPTALREAATLRNFALKMFTDREKQAKAYWQEGFYKTVAIRFRGTSQAEYARTHCDKLKSYFVN